MFETLMTGSQNVRFQRKIPTPMDFHGLMFRRAKELFYTKTTGPQRRNFCCCEGVKAKHKDHFLGQMAPKHTLRGDRNPRCAL